MQYIDYQYTVTMGCNIQYCTEKPVWKLNNFNSKMCASGIKHKVFILMRCLGNLQWIKLGQTLHKVGYWYILTCNICIYFYCRIEVEDIAGKLNIKFYKTSVKENFNIDAGI